MSKDYRIRMRKFAASGKVEAFGRFMYWLKKNRSVRILIRPRFLEKKKRGNFILQVTYIKEPDGERIIFTGDCENSIKNDFDAWHKEHEEDIDPISMTTVLLTPIGWDAVECSLAYSFRSKK